MAEPERKIVLKLKCYTSSPRQRAAAYKFILDENDRSLKHECEFYELVAVRQGDGDFHYNGKVMPVVRNEVYLIPPHVPHFYSGYTHLSMLHFIFMPEVLDPYLERFEQEPGFRLLLCHHPEVYRDYVRGRNIDFTLCGHAHGGQIQLFGRGLYAPGQGVFPKLTHGLHDSGRMMISRGMTNGAKPRIPRINNPCELILLELEPKKGDNKDGKRRPETSC